MTAIAKKPFGVSAGYWFSMSRTVRRAAWQGRSHGRDLFGIGPYLDRSPVAGSRACRCEECADARSRMATP